MFDVTNPSSFEKLGNIFYCTNKIFGEVNKNLLLESWIKEVRKHGAVSARIVVVGNKADLRTSVSQLMIPYHT